MLKKKPCDKCPYKLGLINTFVNPCPQCELDGHKAFEMFQKQAMGESKDEKKDIKGD